MNREDAAVPLAPHVIEVAIAPRGRGRDCGAAGGPSYGWRASLAKGRTRSESRTSSSACWPRADASSVPRVSKSIWMRGVQPSTASAAWGCRRSTAIDELPSLDRQSRPSSAVMSLGGALRHRMPSAPTFLKPSNTTRPSGPTPSAHCAFPPRARGGSASTISTPRSRRSCPPRSAGTGPPSAPASRPPRSAGPVAPRA